MTSAASDKDRQEYARLAFATAICSIFRNRRVRQSLRCGDIQRSELQMSENNTDSENALSKPTISDLEREGEKFLDNLEVVFEKYPPVGNTFASFYRLLNVTANLLGQELLKEREAIRSELRACVDEVAQDYAEFEASELKRRFDQVFEKQNKVIERHSEMLQELQNRLK